ncbi:MAG: triose-phosphate isomerase [Phycisphaera sp.]|nr:triose-phosphate isomerase [Phycisphaera sp.]
MTPRKPIVGGNWKMNLHRAQAVDLAKSLVDRVNSNEDVEVILFPPFPYLEAVGKVLRDASSPIRLGAQDFYHQPNGAYTGEVSISMLADLGVTNVLVGHSERRHVIGENDVLLNQKVLAGLKAGMEVMLCVGEKLEQREANQTDDINAGQTRYGLAGVDPKDMARVSIAYEPVWAIGTGKTATAADAQNAHVAIREVVARQFSTDIAQHVRILYGGSVKGSNAPELFAQSDIDGGLIGGAALKADDFMAIIDAATNSVSA